MSAILFGCFCSVMSRCYVPFLHLTVKTVSNPLGLVNDYLICDFHHVEIIAGGRATIGAPTEIPLLGMKAFVALILLKRLINYFSPLSIAEFDEALAILQATLFDDLGEFVEVVFGRGKHGLIDHKLVSNFFKHETCLTCVYLYVIPW